MRQMELLWPEYHPLERVPTEDVLAVVAFGHAPQTDALTVEVPIAQRGRPVAEVWRTDRLSIRGRHANVQYASNGEVLFGSIRANGDDTHALTARLYDEIISAAKAAGYPHLLRLWNHVGAINEDERQLERYKRFSAGRHDAMTSRGFDRTTFPAASAVGSPHPGLIVYFIAARYPALHIENPRQVAAYDYPECYGPRSPSFARATVTRWGNGGDILFVSGTSSVVGHETRHAGDVDAQLSETLRNLDAIIGEAAKKVDRCGSAADLSVAKIYIRRPADAELVCSRLRSALPKTQLLLLQSDICRRDLLLEIDGVVRLGPIVSRPS
jgi:chorismate lyase / 3-hydroxybenzoate synthase